ncbi:hypothetical protein PSY15_23970, partial [Shigella flexneri]|nr:hypothetical protein [Shigella flexneri]
MGIERTSLGSLLDHTGAFAKCASMVKQRTEGSSFDAHVGTEQIFTIVVMVKICSVPTWASNELPSVLCLSILA